MYTIGMSERNVVSDQGESALTAQELPHNAQQVKRFASSILGRRFDQEGVRLWWESPHSSLGISPDELLEIDPSAAWEYVDRWKI